MIKHLLQKHIKIVITVLHVINGGDVIQFVQDYFNLPFKDAIKKINYDFNLGIKTGRLSKQEYKELEEEKEREKKRKEEHDKEMLNICKTIITYEKLNEILKSQLAPYNWEEIEQTRSLITNHLEILNEEFDELNVKMY